MGVELNADDVFAMAEHIETQAAQFYAHLAMTASTSETRRLLQDLARMEEDHTKVFVGMRAAVAGPGSEPTAKSREHSRIVAIMSIDIKTDLESNFDSNDSTEQLIRKAIDFEKDSVTFFSEMKGMLPDPADREKVDAIIKEELGHILALTGCLASSTPTITVKQLSDSPGLHGRAGIN